MAQYARPNSDVQWSLLGATPTDTTGNRYTNVDETTPSDTDYVYSQNNPGGGSFVEFGLSAVTDPGVSTGHVLRIRTAQIDEDSGTHPLPADTTGTATTCGYDLYQGGSGGTLITTGSINPGNFTTTTINLTTTEADLITDYSTLTVYMNPSGGGGAPTSRRAVAISWVEFEVPSVITTSNVSGQALAYIKLTYSGYAQAHAIITYGVLDVIDTFSRTTSPNDWGAAETGTDWHVSGPNSYYCQLDIVGVAELNTFQNLYADQYILRKDIYAEYDFALSWLPNSGESFAIGLFVQSRYIGFRGSISNTGSVDIDVERNLINQQTFSNYITLSDPLINWYSFRTSQHLRRRLGRFFR